MKHNSLPLNDHTIDAVMILWRRGLDTYDIALTWFVEEADVCRVLTAGRERSRAKAMEVAR